MANYFDQFDDAPKAQAGNYFDQFDAPVASPKADPQFGLQKAWQDLKGATNAAVQAGGQGLSFGFADEAQSALAAAIASTHPDIKFKDAYQDAMEIFKQKRNQASQDYPAAYYPAEVAGALATGGAAADNIGGAALAKSFATNPLKTAAGVGALSGGIYGAGTGDGGIEERLKSAGVSGGIGALAGPAGSYVASKVPGIISKLIPQAAEAEAPGARSLQDLVTEAENKSLVAKGDISSDSTAANKIVDKIKADFPDNYNEVIDAWKSGDKPLAQLYGNRLTTLAKGAAQYPSGKAQADAYFNSQIASAPDRIKAAINENISGVQNYHATVDDILNAGRAKAAPLYQEAFDNNQNIMTPEINRIINTPAGQAALRSAANKMQNDMTLLGVPDKELAEQAKLAGTYQPGTGGIASGFKLRTLDYMKRSLDDQIGAAQRAGEKDNARILTGLKSDLVNKLDSADKTGAYREARNVSGDYFKTTAAMDAGTDFMKVDAETLKRNLEGMTGAEKTAFKVGVGKQLRDVIDSKYEGANPYNKIMGSFEQQKRLMTILSPKEYQNLESSLKSENRLYKMRNDVLGGSPTASKAVAAAEIAPGGADALMSLATGDVRGLGFGAVKNIIGKAFDGLSDKTADSVSRLLYETDPTKKVLMLEKMMGNKELSDTEKQIVKSAYFKAADLSKTRAQGAVGASTILSPENQ